MHAPQNEKGIYDPNGLMPADGPQTVLNVLSALNPRPADNVDPEPDNVGHQLW